MFAPKLRNNIDVTNYFVADNKTYMSKPKSAAVKDIYRYRYRYRRYFGHKYQYRIDIGKGDIDPPLGFNLLIKYSTLVSSSWVRLIILPIFKCNNLKWKMAASEYGSGYQYEVDFPFYIAGGISRWWYRTIHGLTSSRQ